MRSLTLRSIPILLALANLTLVACDEATDPTVTGPGKSLLSEAAPIPITTCGTVITQPGVYEMNTDFGNGSNPHQTCPGPVVEIRVSNVTVFTDGGHGVDGNGGPCITAGVGVPGGVSHIRLINLDLRSCTGGAIVFENVSVSVVENAVIWFNGGAGIAIKGSPALSRDDTVRTSSFFDSGIAVGPGSGFIVSDNTVEALFDYEVSSGVTLSGDVSHSVIRRNTVTGSGVSIIVGGHRNSVISNVLDVKPPFGSAAIAVGGQRNIIAENRVRNRGPAGIEDGGAYNTLRGNTVENGGTGIEEFGRYAVINGNTVQNANYGISVHGSGIRVNGNRVSNNAEVGILVGGGANVIAENTALNNAGFDLQDYLECGANTWRRNTFGTASAPCIQ